MTIDYDAENKELNNSNKTRLFLCTLLHNIDSEFFPPISVQEGNIERYVDNLLMYGNVSISRKNNDVSGVLGYFKTENNMQVDLLWIRSDKRKTSALYDLLKNAVALEEEFNGVITVKTHDKNKRMVSILEKIGFSLSATIKADYVPERTSLLYQSHISNIRKYFCIGQN